jgi:Cytochrome P460
MSIRHFALSFILFVCGDSHAYFEVAGKSTGVRVMNDITFDNYQDLTSWHLVTVRFREDSGEMRFVYANDLAWKAMRDLVPNYPDGAVFGKVAFVTEPDPAFPSSKVPGSARRYQFMVRDKKKYSESDGWGYALFDQEGFRFNEDPKSATQACVACHRIVPERGYVFSRPVFFQPSETTSLGEKPGKHVFSFKQRPLAEVTKEILADLDTPAKSADFLEGDLKKNAFSGTLDEVIPLLITRSKTENRPSVLLVDRGNFSGVFPLGKSKACPYGKSGYRIVVLYNSKRVRDAELCD